jgi:hypothetical protein
VTSSRRTALSVQAPVDSGAEVPSGVPGVVAVEASEVAVAVSVGTEIPGFVGGRVAVTKRARVGAGAASETLIQAARLRLTRRVKVQIFFISGFYLERIR